MIDTKLTAHLAELSKLAFTEEELTVMTKEMNDIVSLMDTVSDFDATNVFHVTEAVEMKALREDKAKPSMDRQGILANAKEKEDTFFKVPKVV